ncbi:MAG: AraC family transcriptional regulator [Eubacteriales bacterium]
MRQFLIDRLSQITDEERDILAGKGIDRKIYTSSADSFIVSSQLMMRAGNKIAVRTHTRFTPFQIHGHNYMEMMYVASGSIVHLVEGRRLILESGDLILLNRHTQHAIEKAGENDLGINFIVSPDFIQSILGKFDGSSDFRSFLAENLCEEGGPSFMVYRTAAVLPIENLIESLVYSMTFGEMNSPEILIESITLLFHLLSESAEALISYHSTDPGTSELTDFILSYIRSDYKNATLSALAAKLYLSPTYLSRWISKHMNMTFKQLLMEQRFTMVEKLLRSTDLPVSEIIRAVGYENKSYFHREFLRRYGCSPLKWRKMAQNGQI